MTSSQESPLHVSNMVKSESNDSATTSFVTTKARRPTSLTESYSNDTGQKSKPDVPSANAPAAAPNAFKAASINRTKPSQENTTKSVQLSSSSTPSSSVNNKPKQPISSTSSSSAAASNKVVAASATSKLKHPIKPSSSQNSIGSNKSANRNKRTAYEERQTLLPKPDGQSPKLQRHESPDTSSSAAKKDTEQASPGKTSGSSSKGSKNTFSSPTRSIATSEIEGLELEYDDFIEDDPLSYFDYEETQKLAFRGVEKLGKTPVEEEEEENGV